MNYVRKYWHPGWIFCFQIISFAECQKEYYNVIIHYTYIEDYCRTKLILTIYHVLSVCFLKAIIVCTLNELYKHTNPSSFFVNKEHLRIEHKYFFSFCEELSTIRMF